MALAKRITAEPTGATADYCRIAWTAMKLRALAALLLLPGPSLAQTLPAFTGPTGAPAARGDAIKLQEMSGAVGSKQDYMGTTALLSFPQAGVTPCTGGDDTPVFVAALAKIAAQGGGTVLIPPATCRVSATITLPAFTRLVGHGERSQIVPTASMPAVIQITGGVSAVENLTLSQSSPLAAVGIKVAKPDGNIQPVDVTQVTAVAFPKAVQVVSGNVVRVTGGFYLNNGVAVSFEPTLVATVNDTVSGIYVAGGSGIDAPAPTAYGTGGFYPHAEGLMVTDAVVLPGVPGAFCMRVGAGVHIKWAGGMCDQVMNGGTGFVVSQTVDAVRSLDIGNVWIGANGAASTAQSGISINGPATGVKLHGLHLSGWHAPPIYINGGTGTAQADIAQVSFDNTAATNDISVSHAAVTILQPRYDVSAGVGTGTGGTVTSWP